MGAEQGKQSFLCSLHNNAALTHMLSGLGRSLQPALSSVVSFAEANASCPCWLFTVASISRNLVIPQVFPLRLIQSPSSHLESDLGSLHTRSLSPQKIPVLFMDRCWECRSFPMQPTFHCFTVEAAAAWFSLFRLLRPDEPAGLRALHQRVEDFFSCPSAFVSAHSPLLKIGAGTAHHQPAQKMISLSYLRIDPFIASE